MPRGSSQPSARVSEPRGESSRIIEALDDRIRKNREVTEHGNNWLALQNTSFIDRYVRGEINLGFRRALREESEYGFIACRNPIGERREILAQSPSHDPKLAGHDGYLNQPFMLAHDIETMESPKQFIPSIIRLERFDDRALGTGQPL